MSKTPKPKCLSPECKRAAITRGLCGSCYTTFRRLVSLGEIDDAEAIEAGIVLKPQATPRSPFLRALASKSK